MTLELAQQVVRELYAHKRLTMQTGLLLENLEPSQKDQLSRYLPPLEGLSLDDNYNWALLFAGVGFLTDFVALLSQYKNNDQSILAAINGDQGAIFDHILEVRSQHGNPGIEARWLEIVIMRKKYKCALVLARRYPQHFEYLLYNAEQNHRAGMLRWLLQHVPPGVDTRPTYRLEMTSLYKRQIPKMAQVLMEFGAQVTDHALWSAAACDNLELLQFYLQRPFSTEVLNQAMCFALINRSSKVAQWLVRHTTAGPDAFFERADELNLSRSVELVVGLYPQCLEQFLLAATLKGNLRLVKELLDRGASNRAQARQLLLETTLTVIYRQAKLDLLAD